MKRRWEEREKEKKRKIASQESEKQHLCSEVERLEGMIRKEIRDRAESIDRIRSELKSRLENLRRENEEGEEGSQVLEWKRKEFQTLKDALEQFEESLKKYPAPATKDLESEILRWEKKLEEDVPHPGKNAEKLGANSLRNDLEEKKKALSKEKRESDAAILHAKNEAAKVTKAVQEIKERSSGLREGRA